jgi:hypothetical protein
MKQQYKTKVVTIDRFKQSWIEQLKSMTLEPNTKAELLRQVKALQNCFGKFIKQGTYLTQIFEVSASVVVDKNKLVQLLLTWKGYRVSMIDNDKQIVGNYASDMFLQKPEFVSDTYFDTIAGTHKKVIEHDKTVTKLQQLVEALS